MQGCPRLTDRNGSAQAEPGHGEEHEADAGHGGEATPDDVEASAAVSRMAWSEVDVMGRGEDLRESCRPGRLP